jgi:hypothetical protein
MSQRHMVPLLCVLLLSAAVAPGFGQAQSPARIQVQGIETGAMAVSLSAADLALLPQRTIPVTDHGAPVTFQGVLLTDLLAKVATPTGEKFHHTAAAYYLTVEARDGYRAVFAWAELDPTFMDKAIYLLTQRDGKPLTEQEGPFRLVVPGEKRGARWVMQVTALRIRQAN